MTAPTPTVPSSESREAAGVVISARAEMSRQTAMTPEQSFFAVFCIEALADALETTGDKIHELLTEESDILDGYIVPGYEALHTQGDAYIVRELLDLMQKRAVLQ